MEFADDRPIFNADQDELHRAQFAGRLAQGLILGNSAASLVIGLEAPWGWGKTSVINLARNALRREQAIVIDFQPWLVGPRDALVQSFLIQLAAAIQLKDRAKEGKEAAEQLLKYSSLFNVLKLVPGAEPWATITHKVIKGVGNAAKDVSQLKQLDVDGQRKKVIAALSRIDRPIVVVVDDLDRLPPKEVFEVIRFVKAVADFDRVSYLLAYDHAHVTSALKSVGIKEGEKFLEKIVQVRLHVPPVSPSDARLFLEQRLARFTYMDQARIFPNVAENVSDVYLPHLRRLLDSPRAIVRLINRLEVSYRMTADEVVFGDLLGLESLAILAPGLYEGIKAQPERFLGVEELSLVEHFEEKKSSERAKEFRTELFEESIPSRIKRDVAGLVDKLFPLESDYTSISMNDARRNGNIVEISRLRIALNLGALPDDIPLDVVRNFVNAPGSRVLIVDGLPDDLRILERFVELVGDFVEGDDVVDPTSFSIALGSLLNRNEFKLGASSSGPADMDRQIAACLELAIKSARPENKIRYLTALLQSSDTAWLAMRGVELIIRREEQSRPLLSPEQESEIIRLWQASIEEQLASEQLLRQPFAGPALFAWRRIKDGTFQDQARAYARKSDEHFIELARVLGNSVFSSSSGRIARWSTDLVQDLGDEETVRSRANALLEEDISMSKDAKASLLSLANKRSYVVNTLQPTDDW